jgi:predicted solute-binding protein
VCAVSFLNTVPLVWGMLHGEQRGRFDISFAVPSECADRLEQGSADIGIVPVVELARLDLEIIEGTGIACRGPARSVLLVSRKPLREIRTLAADSSSRTSVALARVILAELHGVTPELRPMPPVLARMLEAADAAVLIGDPALNVDPDRSPFEVRDLGSAWVELTGKPMVFAVWAGRRRLAPARLAAEFAASCRFGLERMEEIVAAESARRRLAPELVRNYLTRNVVLELGENEREGLKLFLEQAARLDAISPNGIPRR